MQLPLPEFKKKSVKIIYTDAGYSSKKRIGYLAVKNKKVKIKKVKVPHIPGLKQYSNLLELQGVLEGLKSTKAKNVILYTDSRVAVCWFNRRYNNLDKFSEHHYQAKLAIDIEKKRFNSLEVKWVPRDENPAGVALEQKFSI